MDIFPGVLLGMYHIKLSLVDPNSSVDVSRRDRTKPSKPTEKLFSIFMEIEQLVPHGNSPSPHTLLHLPGTVELQLISSELM